MRLLNPFCDLSLTKAGQLPLREALSLPSVLSELLPGKRSHEREFLIYFRRNRLHLQQSMEKFKPKDILKNSWGCGKTGIRRLVYLLDKYSSFPKRTGEEITERRTLWDQNKSQTEERSLQRNPTFTGLVYGANYYPGNFCIQLNDQ